MPDAAWDEVQLGNRNMAFEAAFDITAGFGLSRRVDPGVAKQAATLAGVGRDFLVGDRKRISGRSRAAVLWLVGVLRQAWQVHIVA